MRSLATAVLFALVASVPAEGRPQCLNQKIMEAIYQSPDWGGLEASKKVDLIVNTILGSKQAIYRSPDPGGVSRSEVERHFENFLVSLKGREGYVPANSLDELPEDAGIDDLIEQSKVLIFALEVPPTGQDRVWQGLNLEEKEHLLERLVEGFRRGVYEFDETDALDSVSNMHPERAAVSPRVLLAKACQKRPEVIGVCRHSASALAGLLLELGTNPKHVELVSSGEHMIVRVRLAAHETWTYYDPTPGTRSTPSTGQPYPEIEVETETPLVPVDSLRRE